MSERIKKVVFIILLAGGSAFFLYSGFSMLFSEQSEVILQPLNPDDN